jgi:thymidylate synthase (FAD)
VSEISVLDKGFVRLVDYMGSDDAVVEAARVSYAGAPKRKVREDAALIDYLMEHWHTTPFEMCEVKFHCKMPMFVARQWIRHRTANVNEYSGRYSVMKEEAYVPEPHRFNKQSTTNKQGSSMELMDHADAALELWKDEHQEAFGNYQYYLEHGMSKELARCNLPLSTYTEWYWKIDLHNLFHFLRLRLDSHAQYEIRVYAEAMYELIKPLFPMACESFQRHRLDAVTFSADEIEVVKGLVDTINAEALDLLYVMVNGDVRFRSTGNRKGNALFKKLGLPIPDQNGVG